MEEKYWIETVLKQKDFENSISQVVNIKDEPLSSNGDYYTSLVSNITLDVILKSGRKIKISVVQKKAKQYDKDAFFQVVPFLKKEIIVYKTVFTRFNQLMNENQDYNDKLWCDLLGYDPYSLMIFENIKMENYKIANRKDLLDLNHAKLVMHSLGRFHALGHVLVKKDIISKEDFPQYYTERHEPFVKNLFQIGLKQFAKLIKSHWPSDWKHFSEKLANEDGVILKKLRDLFIIQDNCFQTICHGDCWTCNIFFKYCPYDNTLPIALKFIDFGCVHVNSYIFDLDYFLYVSVQPEIRKNNLNHLFKIYQKSLKSTLSHYGLEEDAPTIEHICAEAKRTEYYAFIKNLLFLPLTSSDTDANIQLEKIQNILDENEEIYRTDIFICEKNQKILGSELKHWQERGVI